MRRHCAFIAHLVLILSAFAIPGCKSEDKTSDASSTGALPLVQGHANVVVAAGSSAQFSQSNATWSLAAGSAGTITPDGLFTAPPHVDVQHAVNGVQTLPSDHIYFAPITNLPLAPNNSTLMSTLHASTGPFVGAGVSYALGFHVNVLDSSVPSIPMTFLYTGERGTVNYNGPYQFLSGNEQGSPWYGIPGEWIQAGIYMPYTAAVDRHNFGVNIETGTQYEVYNAYPLGSDTGSPETNAVSGASYGLTQQPYSIGPGAVAGGQLLGATLVTAHEIRTHLIRHVSLFTLPNGTIAGGSHCPCFIWPATARAYEGGGYLPYGARLRLDPSIDTVNNPKTGQPYSLEAQAVFQAWKDYGIMLSDGGMDGQIEVDSDIMEDPALGTPFLAEVSQGPTTTDGKKIGDWSHWNVVDESSLETTGTDAWLSGQVNPANAYYHPATATAVATDKTSGAQTSYPIVLQGVTVGVPNSVETIQSGVTLQMQSWVRGTSDLAVHWTMSPELGTLTDDGSYTAPAVTTPTMTLLTVTADADSQMSTTVRVVVFPAGSVHMLLGPSGNPYQAKPYEDSKGNVWQPIFTGRIPYIGLAEYWEYGTGANAPGKLFPLDTVDPGIWRWQRRGEQEYRLKLPNGTYTVTLYMGIGGVGTALAPHTYEQSMECQGETHNPDYDWAAAGGGFAGVALTYPMTCVVTNGELDFGIHGVVPENQTAGTTPTAALNAFSVVKQ